MKLKSKEVKSLEKEMFAVATKLKEMGASDVFIISGIELDKGGRTFAAIHDGNEFAIGGMVHRWLNDLESGVIDEYQDALDEAAESQESSEDDDGDDIFDKDGNLK